MRVARTRYLLTVALAACASTEPPPAVPPPAPPAPAPSAPAQRIRGVPAVPTAPVPSPQPAMPRRPAPLPLEPSNPPGAIALPCTLRAEIEPTIVEDELRLRFMLSNSGNEPATITLRGTCPGGVVELLGLPAPFDPFHRCVAGACVNPTTEVTYTVPPHEAVAIGGTTLHAKGDACNPPLPMGSSFLSATITPHTQRVDTCTGAAVHIVRDPKTGALRQAGLLEPSVPATPRKPQPKPTPQPKQEPRPKPERKPQPPPKPKHCPACGIGCPNGIPKSGIGPDGCPECGCEPFPFPTPP